VSLVVTDAIVLHAFDYRETSRILRIATREAGVRSVIARGARRPKSRFGTALDLFAEGSAQVLLHSTRDLHTLVSFDVTQARPALAGRWPRFAAANALSEILLRFASDDAHPGLYDAYAGALSALESADADAASAGLAGAWRLVAELGFAPSLDQCASCGAPLEPDATVRFAHRLGGALCAKCAGGQVGARDVPPAARAAIGAWIGGETPPLPDARSTVSHLRLLREFLNEHLTDHRPLRAFAVWEHGDWLPR
jgi:DNA repair protein RecO (recombination protein O)